MGKLLVDAKQNIKINAKTTIEIKTGTTIEMEGSSTAKLNAAKHGVDFFEAQSVFLDPLVAIRRDDDHSTQEERFAALGMSHLQRLLVVIFVERGERIRIISARRATRGERKAYEG